MARKSGLGRGLDALIPEAPQPPSGEGARQVPIDDILPNPHQPRQNLNEEHLQELADSIQEHGIIQPLIVTHDTQHNQYVLIAGERRLRAAKLAGLQDVPVILREATNQEQLELALIENVQRADLTPLETAEAYDRLQKDFNLSHNKIAEKVGKSRVAVTNTLRLLKLPASVKKALAEETISEGHARALLGLPNAQAQAAALQTVLKRSLSVRQTEELVNKLTGEKPQSRPKPDVAPEIRAIEEQLRSHLGTKVTLHHGKKGGSVVIHYYSDEELDALMSQLLKD